MSSHLILGYLWRYVQAKVIGKKNKKDVHLIFHKKFVSSFAFCSKNNNQSIFNNRTISVYFFGSFVKMFLRKQNHQQKAHTEIRAIVLAVPLFLYELELENMSEHSHSSLR